MASKVNCIGYSIHTYISFFYPSLLFTCFALLCLTFILLLFLVCFAFYVNWNVFLTNIRHVFLGAQRDRLSEMVLLSTHNI